MNSKRNITKASSVVSYVATFIWFVLAAGALALSKNTYWLYAAFGLISLYDGFLVSSIRREGKGNEIVALILSIVSIPSFILNLIALCQKLDGKEEDTIVVFDPKAEKPLLKSGAFITMCVAFVLIFCFSFSAHMFETVGGSVKVSDFTLTQEMTQSYNGGEVNGKKFVMPNDTTYSCTMYVPKTATEAHPAPVVFVIPGFTRTKSTMSQYAIELARRGFVVFTSDPGGQGGTTETSTTGANGVEYLVQYVYNNTDDFKFIDRSRFGAVGHSAGGGNVCTLAADMAGSSYAESVIKAVYISGYIKVSSANKYKTLHSNAALSYAYYDEGAFRYQTDLSSFEVIARRFLNEVSGAPGSYDDVAYDYGYGDKENGTYRIVHREAINHCFEMYDPASIANTVNFFDEMLDNNSGMEGHDQIWFCKELSNGLALASAFTFIISLAYVLMRTPLFASMKKEEKRIEKKIDKSISHRVIFWFCMIATAILACLDYIPLANLSIEIFPVGNSSSTYTFVFPARMINSILLWASINGAIGLVIFFGTTLIEYAIDKMRGKDVSDYDWGKFTSCLIEGKGVSGVLINIVKSLLMAFGLFGVFYLLVKVNYMMFHQDFRFTMVSAAPLNARMFLTALEYMPIIFIFYISNSIRVNCSIGREGWKEWKVILVGALANSIGLMFILLINYVCYFTTGTPYYGYWGNGTEIWLYVNMVFGLVVMMFILPIFNRLFYKATGNVWVGAITCCMIFVMMTISASVSYIPLY
ncbi:MAG: hypothetical protein KBS81_11080 [Spirochaetales bacterium]|nr:hypothetical protein [Candidatus Physcosoma equi]